jgi:hypothetical protein
MAAEWSLPSARRANITVTISQARTPQQSDLLEGVVITGASKVHELIKRGAAALSF